MAILRTLESRATAGVVGPPRDPVVAEWLGMGSRSASGMNVTADTAMRVTAVFRCVSLRSQTLASLPLTVERNLADGGHEVARQHAMFNTLAYRPNRWQTSFEWREMMEAHFCLRGRCYSELVSTGGRGVAELVPLHPDRVIPFRAPDGKLAFKYTPLDGAERIILQSEMFYLHLMSMDGVNPISPIGLHREAVGLALATEEHGARLFGNGARPGGLLKMAGSLKDQEAVKRLRESWSEVHGGVSNSNRIAVLENGLEWQQVGMTSEDAQFLETRNLQISEICRIFGVPPHKVGELTRCMPADTLVFAVGGPKRIADVVVGDQVWSPTPDGMVLRKVTNTWNNGTRELIEIRTTNRTVRCTENHKLLVRRELLRELQKGEIGGKNIGGKKMRVEWENQYVMAGELRIGDTLVTLDKLPEEGISVAPNGRALTPGFMEFAGLLMADGNLTRENGRLSGVQIARGENTSYMEAYRETMAREFRKADGVSVIFFTESVRQTKFKSTVAANELNELGFSGTAFTKRVPGWVFEVPRDLRLAFLRGFLDGDGTVDGKGRITFYSASKPLLDDVRHLCMSCGVPVTNTRADRNSGKAFCPKSGEFTLMHRFTCSDPGANSEIGSHDDRYIVRFASGKSFCKKDRAYPRFGGTNFNMPGASLARISSIAQVAAEPTFDIEVEESHCFIADGVVSHNSTNNNIEHQGIEWVTDTIGPQVVRWEQAMQRDLFGDRYTHSAMFDMDGLMRGDSDARSKFYASASQNGWMNRNEIRRLEGRNASTEGGMDDYTVQMNMIKIGDMGKTDPKPLAPEPKP